MRSQDASAPAGRGWAVPLALLALAALASACGRLALTWDGAYHLFKVVDDQRLFILDGRWGAAPLQWVALVSSRVTQDAQIVAWGASLAYASVPLLAAGLSWLVLERSDKPLFVWAVLAIGPAMLPGQLYLVSESTMATQLFGPLALCLLTARGTTPKLVVVAALTVAATCLLHPNAALLMVVAAVLAAASPAMGRARWILVLAMVAGAAIRLAIVSDLAEKQALSWLDFVGMTRLSLFGLAGLGLACFAACGAALALGASRGTTGIALAFAAAGGVLFAAWALRPESWANAFAFRRPAPFIGVGVWALAWLDVARQRRGAPIALPARRALAALAAATVAATLSLQSLEWRELTGRLAEELARAPAPCVAAGSVGWVRGTALDHWSSPVLALWLQGRAPARLFLREQSCEAEWQGEDLRLVSWEVRPRSGGWFDLRGAGR